MKTNSLTLSLLCFLFVVFLLCTTNAQFKSEDKLTAPFFSSNSAGLDFQHAQQIAGNVMNNSAKEIVYIENLGQISDAEGNKMPDVLFFTSSQGVDMYITKTGITYIFVKDEEFVSEYKLMQHNKDEVNRSIYRLDMDFLSMNKNFNIVKEQPIEQQFFYFKPNYPNGISPKGFRKITLENLYEGIDLVYYEQDGKMRYDFIVREGADATNIKIKYKGAENLKLDENGSVVVTTPLGEIRDEKPFTYSKNTGEEIESGYIINDMQVQFALAEHKRNEDIIIDPFRSWASYYGGNHDDVGFGICTDNSGNIYVTGYARSSDFPTQTLAGAYDQGFTNVDDAFILKFNSSGVRLWATYYGGSNYDRGYDITTDNFDNVYVTGRTAGGSFPTDASSGGYIQTHGGANDVFILKFNSSGARQWATFYGGSSADEGYGIRVDNMNNLYVIGHSISEDFPIQSLSGAFNQGTYGGGDGFGGDIFVLKFNSMNTRLWATYYGGDAADYAYGIDLDNSDNLYVSGWTQSTNFPTQALAGAYNQSTVAGTRDVVILKFNSSGAREWATHYGGGNWDQNWDLCTDNTGNLYVTGWSQSGDLPTQVLAGAYNQSYSGSNDAFILKFNSSSAREWATYYGDGDNDQGWCIDTDNSGNLYVSGYTYSSNFPTQTLAGAYNQTLASGPDLFISRFNSSGVLTWSTFYGGTQIDIPYSIFADDAGNLHVAGETTSNNFPVLSPSGSYSQSYASFKDAFIISFSPTPVSVKYISSEIPSSYSLLQNYPNPFNPTTKIGFQIVETELVSLKVYDILGNEVAILVNEEKHPGSYEVDFKATSSIGRLTSGIYFYKLQAGNFIETKKMLLMK